MFALGLVLLVLLPPVGVVYLLWLFFWKEPRDEKKEFEQRALRSVNWFEVEISGPGPCAVCGETAWGLGPMTLVPSGSFRIFGWPMDGIVAVRRFHCTNCGSIQRFGLCKEKAEQGWVPLDRWAGGW